MDCLKCDMAHKRSLNSIFYHFVDYHGPQFAYLLREMVGGSNLTIEQMVELLARARWISTIGGGYKLIQKHVFDTLLWKNLESRWRRE